MLQSFFPVNNEVQTKFLHSFQYPLKTLVNSEIMQIQQDQIFTFFGLFIFRQKNLGKVGEKQSILRLSMKDREISPLGSEFNQGLGKPCPWLKFQPLRRVISIQHGHSWWIVIITGLQIRVRNGKLFFLLLNQNKCCGYSKEPSQ